MRLLLSAGLLAASAICGAASAQNLIFTNTSPVVAVPLESSSTLYAVDERGAPHFVPVAQLVDARAQCILDSGTGDCVKSIEPIEGAPTLDFGGGVVLGLLEGSTLEWFDGSTTTTIVPRSVTASCIRSGPGCIGFPPPVAPPTVTLAASANEVEAGELLTLWSTAGNEAVCERSAIPHVPAWSRDGPPSASVTFSLAAAGAYTFSLRCSNSGGWNEAAVSVLVTAGVAPACAPPSDSTRQPSPSAYDQLFASPFANTNAGTLDLAPSEYSSIAIDVPPGSGGEGFFVASPSGSTAQVAMTLAMCAGDFSFAALPAACSRIGNGKALAWRIGEPAPGKCVLTPGQTYYLNTAFRDVLLAPTCVGAQCRATIAQSNVSVTQPIPTLAQPSTFASLGASVAVAGDVLVAGLPDVAQSTGRVYVYRKAAGTAAWTFEAEIAAGDAAVGDAFGTAVAVSGDARTILVGAPFDDHGGKVDAGSARVFRMSGSSWADSPTEETLVAADAADRDRYGTAVDVSPSGAAFIIGAPEKAGTGSAYSFKSPAGGLRTKTDVTRTTPLPVVLGKVALAIGDKFGAAVATDSDEEGGRWIVGLPGRDLGTGAVRSLRDVGGTFVFNEEAVAPGSNPGDAFGSSVDITGNKFVAGSPGDDVDPDGIEDGDPDDDVVDQGSATVFRYGEDDSPLPPQPLMAPQGGTGDAGGSAVAIAEDVVVVGHPRADVPGLFGNLLEDSGRIDVHRLDGATDAYAFSQSQGADDAASGDQYGRAVSSDGRTIAVGAPARATRAGGAYPLDATRVLIFGSSFEAP